MAVTFFPRQLQKVAKSLDGRIAPSLKVATLFLPLTPSTLLAPRLSGKAWAGILGNKWVGTTNTTAIWAKLGA
jgi:hypothetical protein